MSALSRAEPARAGRQTPERGPRILFFSGGTALRPLCRVLKRATHNSIHLVTTFDSGGSSGALREAFAMPAIGDVRSRLLALADEDVPGASHGARLVSHRLDTNSDTVALKRELEAMIAGDDPLVTGAQHPLREFAQVQLQRFIDRSPVGFDLRGASIGNLILTGAWLRAKSLTTAIRELSALLAVRGEVHPTLDANLHLAAMLEDGQRVVGQHRITGKEHPPLPSVVRSLHLVSGLEAPEPADVAASPAVLEAIRTADLICFPMGSFFSSVLCNLLPRGIGRAVADAECPKLYVPNTGNDPEMREIGAARATELLLGALRQDAGADVATDKLLHSVLLAKSPDAYLLPTDAPAIARLGIEPLQVLDARGAPASARLDAEQISEILVSLANREDLGAEGAEGAEGAGGTQ